MIFVLSNDSGTRTQEIVDKSVRQEVICEGWKYEKKNERRLSKHQETIGGEILDKSDQKREAREGQLRFQRGKKVSKFIFRDIEFFLHTQF